MTTPKKACSHAGSRRAGQRRASPACHQASTIGHRESAPRRDDTTWASGLRSAEQPQRLGDGDHCPRASARGNAVGAVEGVAELVDHLAEIGEHALGERRAIGERVDDIAAPGDLDRWVGGDQAFGL